MRCCAFDDSAHAKHRSETTCLFRYDAALLFHLALLVCRSYSVRSLLPRFQFYSNLFFGSCSAAPRHIALRVDVASSRAVATSRVRVAVSLSFTCFFFLFVFIILRESSSSGGGLRSDRNVNAPSLLEIQSAGRKGESISKEVGRKPTVKCERNSAVAPLRIPSLSLSLSLPPRCLREETG